ncbi:MAG: glycosyltransferase family A protein [Christiangramia sp.]|nr:hypothetical protein [Christiangramia sp.]
MQNLVTIIIPTFNRAETLPKTLRSVQNQSHQNWECLVIDDGSEDQTEKILQEFLKDNRFRFLKRPEDRKKGAATCRNIGLENAQGDYIQFLDSDDLLAPNKLEVQLIALQENNAHLATCKWGVLRSGSGEVHIYDKLPTYHEFEDGIRLFDAFGYYFTYFPPHVYLASREVIEKSGYWNEELTLNDDGDYFSKVIFNSGRVIFCAATHVLYRRGGGERISSDYSEYGIQSFIQSWSSIDERIMENYDISNHIFVRQARRNLYSKIADKHPQLVERHQDFFDKRMSTIEYFLRKANAKIKGYI